MGVGARVYYNPVYFTKAILNYVNKVAFVVRLIKLDFYIFLLCKIFYSLTESCKIIFTINARFMFGPFITLSFIQTPLDCRVKPDNDILLSVKMLQYLIYRMF